MGNLAVYGPMPPEYALPIAAEQVEKLKAIAAWNDTTAVIRFVPTRSERGTKVPAVTIREVVLRAP